MLSKRHHVEKTMVSIIYVINCDESSSKGKHWVALYNGSTECFYFDSFGVRPSPEVESVINKPCYYNTYRIQDFDSNKYGYFCIKFPRKRSWPWKLSWMVDVISRRFDVIWWLQERSVLVMSDLNYL